MLILLININQLIYAVIQKNNINVVVSDFDQYVF